MSKFPISVTPYSFFIEDKDVKLHALCSSFILRLRPLTSSLEAYDLATGALLWERAVFGIPPTTIATATVDGVDTVIWIDKVEETQTTFRRLVVTRDPTPDEHRVCDAHSASLPFFGSFVTNGNVVAGIIDAFSWERGQFHVFSFDFRTGKTSELCTLCDVETQDIAVFPQSGDVCLFVDSVKLTVFSAAGEQKSDVQVPSVLLRGTQLSAMCILDERRVVVSGLMCVGRKGGVYVLVILDARSGVVEQVIDMYKILIVPGVPEVVFSPREDWTGVFEPCKLDTFLGIQRLHAVSGTSVLVQIETQPFLYSTVCCLDVVRALRFTFIATAVRRSLYILQKQAV